MARILRVFTVCLLAASFGLAQSAPDRTSNSETFPVFALNPVPVSGANISLVGQPGPATWYFWAATNFQLGSMLSPIGFITNAPNTLDTNNYVVITPYAYPAGATSVDILATPTSTPPTGACNCAVATGLTSGSASFQSNTLSSYTVSILNAAAYSLVIRNEVVGTGSTHLLLRNAYTGALVADLSAAAASGLPTGCANGNTATYNTGTGLWQCSAAGTGTISGSGTTNAIPRFTGPSVLGNSGFSDNGTTITASEKFAITLSNSDLISLVATPTLCSGSTTPTFTIEGAACRAQSFLAEPPTSPSGITAGLFSQAEDGLHSIGTQAALAGVYGVGYVISSGSAPYWLAGVAGLASADAFSGTIPHEAGLVGIGKVTGTQTISLLAGAYAQVQNTNASTTVPLGAAFYADTAVATGPFTALYGFYENGSAQNYFGGALTVGGNLSVNVTGLTQCLHVNASGVISGTGSDCGSGSGAVTSVSNSDSSLTISPTTGAVVASLNVAHSNAWTGLQDFSGAGQIKLPVAASFASLANGEIGYDSANNNWHAWQNGADAIIAPLATGFVSGHCGQPTQTGGVWQIIDIGAPCGSGSGSAFSALTSGTNVSAAMLVGTGASLGPTGTGTLNANQVNSASVPTSTLSVKTNSSGQIVDSSSRLAPTYYTNDQTGSDLCAKITAALLQCPSGATNSCKVVIQATTPGTADHCATGTSDFWSGVTPRIVEFDLQAQVFLKATANFPFTPHFVHGSGSNQSMQGAGFYMDTPFTSTTLFANNSTTLLSGEGPAAFAGQTMNVLISDGGRTSGTAINQWQQNGSGAHWQDIRLDCNNQTNCIPYFTANMEEKSYYVNVALWNQATTCTAAGCNYSIGMFFDHYAAQTGNFGPSHFSLKNVGVNAYENTTGTSPNQTIAGIVYEGANCPPATCTVTGGNAAPTGGNIEINGGTIRGVGSTQLLTYGVWIDGTTNNLFVNTHCEWISSSNNCYILGAGGNATTSTTLVGISDVNNAVNAVHFHTGSNNVVLQSDNGVTDDVNSCNPSGNVDSYWQAGGGSGYWSNTYHYACATGIPVTLMAATGTPSSSTFLRGDGTWSTPAGGGNVSSSGTPTQYQIAAWVSGTAIQGIGPGTSGYPLVSGGASAYPSYAQLGISGLSATGTPSSSTFLRGDNTWATPSGSGTVTASPQYQIPQYSAAGTASTVTGVAWLTGYDGVSQFLQEVTSSGSATSTAPNVAGVPVNAQTGAGYTPVIADRGKLITLSNASAQNLVLTNPTTAGFDRNYVFAAKNVGAGAWTETASGFTVNGATTLLLPPNWTVFNWSDNTNYQASRFPDFSAFPGCTDTGGNHLNFNSTTGVFSCGTSGVVSSVFNSDGTLTISPTTGAVVASIALGHANTWSALQTFGANASIGSTAHGPLLSENTSAAVAAGAGTAGQFFRSGGSGADGAYSDFPERFYIPAANCNNTTAGAGWSIGSGGTVTCRAGTNNKGGFVAITDTSTTFAQFTLAIPEDWDTGSNPYIRFYVASTDTTTGHTIIPAIQVSCSKGDGTTTDDVTFNASHSSSTITLNTTANQFWSNSNVQMNSTDVTGCVAGAQMTVQVGRATDTATNAEFYGAAITFPRLLTVQAN